MDTKSFQPKYNIHLQLNNIRPQILLWKVVEHTFNFIPELCFIY